MSRVPFVDPPAPFRIDGKSVVLASTFKAGSSIAQAILAALLGAAGLRCFALSDHGRIHDADDAAFFAAHRGLLRRPGYFFGAMREAYVPAAALSPVKVIAQIRDPRDCLVSLYFSMRYSHAPPPGEMHRRLLAQDRASAAATTIDEFCLSRADAFGRWLDFVAVLADGHPDFLLLRYEDMVTDFGGWLRAARGFAAPHVGDAALDQLTRDVDFTIAREDQSSHKRQVTPGDHRRKLSTAAIDALTLRLAPQLTRFGYAA